MKHKERFFNSIRHEIIDRVPMDLWVPPWDSTTSANEEIQNSDENIVAVLMKYLGTSSFKQLLDVLDIGFFRYLPSVRKNLNPDMYDESIKYFVYDIESKSFGTYSDTFKRPLGTIETILEIDKFKWPGIPLI
jgi:hypothetical protein